MNNAIKIDQKIDSLDALICIVSLIVCIAHFAIFIDGGENHFLGTAARLSVLCFFALSGFVISDSLLRNYNKNGHINLIDFFKQRFFRIMPPLLAVFLFIITAEILLNMTGITPTDATLDGRTDFHLNLVKVGVSLLSLGAIGDLTGGLNGPLWSLRYEIRCYISAGILAWLLTTPRKDQRWVIAATLFLICYWIVGLFIRNEGLFSAQAPSLITFAAGFAAFRYGPKMKTNIALILGLLFLCAGIFIIGDNISIIDESVFLLSAQSACGIGFALLIIAIARWNFQFKPALLLGQISYTLYILHYPLMLVLFFTVQAYKPEWLSGSASIFLAAGGIAAAIAISAAMAWIFERPAQQRKWFESQMKRLKGNPPS